MQPDQIQEPTRQPESLRMAIKAATRDVHSKLDHSELALKIQSSEVTLSDYITLLKKTYGFVKPLENLVHSEHSPVADLDLRLEVREKAHLIEEDLIWLGVSDEDVRALELMPVSAGTEISKAQAMGILYVLEGSTMGGMVLHQHLTRTLGEQIQGATSFLNCYGRDTREMFMQFVAVLDTFTTDPKEQAEVKDSAFDTFLAIDRWMNG